MKPRALVFFSALAVTAPMIHAEEEIRWLVNYEGKGIPSAPEWTVQGEASALLPEGALMLADTSKEGSGSYRATWKPEADAEIIVEATIRVIETTGVVDKPGSRTLWPWKDGAPVALRVSDGRHQEGLVFYTDRVSTWTDRFHLMDTEKEFHTYRCVIRGTDMSVSVDNQQCIQGQGAFWKPVDEKNKEAFIEFGSTCAKGTGRAEWKSVRLGVRKAEAPAKSAPVKITMCKPWPIERPDLKKKPTRPYVYDIGEGRLLMSVAEGPDALYEPYGVMLSTDEGRTWKPVDGWEFTEKAPLPMLRINDGSVLGFSRWTWPQADGTLMGHTVRWPADLGSSSSYESRITLPPSYFSAKVPLTVERQVFEEADGSLRMAGYSKTGPSTPEGLRVGRRFSHLLRSRDGGRTWSHDAVMGAGGEPAVAKTGEGRMTALLRVGPFKPFHQVFSEDDGKTWSAPVLLEEGSVCADLVPMSNGLLACSYGRPSGCLMFSADGGRTWTSHHVITDKTGFNYSGIVEIKPGRLLYVHDAGGLQALHIDVERLDLTKYTAPATKKPTNDYALRTAKELKPTRTIIYKKIGATGTRDMRVFEPAGHKATDKRPCFLAIHGGGWTAGTPDVMYCVANHFAQRGWLGISMQYRHQRADRGTTVFDAVKDARSAVRYLRAHAAELGIDPNRIVVGGRSAGGHLAIGTAIFEGVDEAGEDNSISCIPNAVICYSAVLDTSENGYGNATIGERWRELSPLHHVRPGLPPTLVLHGVRDTVTPVAGAKAFSEAMVKAGNCCEFVENARGNHSYMMRTQPLFDEAMQQTRAFLAKHVSGVADVR